MDLKANNLQLEYGIKIFHWISLLTLFLLISQLHISIANGFGSIEAPLILISTCGPFFLHQRVSQHSIIILVAIIALFTATLIQSILGLDVELTAVINVVLPMFFAFRLMNLAQTDESIKYLKLSYFLASGCLSLILFYRYFYLHEMREYDGRPLLNIRNGDPNFLAFILTIGMFIGKEFFRETWGKIISALLFLGVIITQSRMGILATFLGGSLYLRKSYFQYSSSKNKLSLVLGILFFVILILLTPGLTDRIENIFDRSNMERIKTWINGFMLFIDNPLVGVGIDRSEIFYYLNVGHPLFQDQEHPLTVHNTWLKIFSEFGLIGSIPLIYWVIKIWKSALKDSFNSVILFTVFFTMTLFIGIGVKDFFILTLAVMQKSLVYRGSNGPA